MESENAFAANLARLRRQRRFSQRELAEKIHTDQSMITRWEKGKVMPRPETIQRLAEVLDVTEDELTSAQPVAKLENAIGDPEMVQLVAQFRELSGPDREILKAVVEAMLMRSRIKSVMAKTG